MLRAKGRGKPDLPGAPGLCAPTLCAVTTMRGTGGSGRSARRAHNSAASSW